jgi:hypothetical protein
MGDAKKEISKTSIMSLSNRTTFRCLMHMGRADVVKLERDQVVDQSRLPRIGPSDGLRRGLFRTQIGHYCTSENGRTGRASAPNGFRCSFEAKEAGRHVSVRSDSRTTTR